MTLKLKVTLEEMDLAINVLLEENPDIITRVFLAELTTGSMPGAKEIPEVVELFKELNWDIDYYQSLHRAEKSDLENNIEHIATTLMSMGYCKEVIDRVIEEYIKQNPPLDD